MRNPAPPAQPAPQISISLRPHTAGSFLGDFRTPKRRPKLFTDAADGVAEGGGDTAHPVSPMATPRAIKAVDLFMAVVLSAHSRQQV
jgi:hypothetical protein